MSYSARDEFPAGAADDLERLRQRAAALQERLGEIQAAAPEHTEGTDRTGAVRVIVGPDGLPESIRVGARWQDQIRPQALGAAVTEASREAVRRRGQAWSATLERPGQPPGSGPSGPVTGHPHAAEGLHGRSPRPLGEIAEDVIGMLDSAPRPGSAPAQARGISTGRTLHITLARDGRLSCAADAEWAAGQSGGQLSQALGAALTAAREELRSQSAGAAGSAERVSQITAEIYAAVSEAARPSAPEGRQA